MPIPKGCRIVFARRLPAVRIVAFGLLKRVLIRMDSPPRETFHASA
jgi:hypothetical protein